VKGKPKQAEFGAVEHAVTEVEERFR
jgi:hypothetical protein